MKIKKIVLDIDGAEVTVSGEDADALTKVLSAIQGNGKEYVPYPIYPEPFTPPYNPWWVEPFYPNTNPWITYTTGGSIWFDAPEYAEDFKFTSGFCQTD